MGGDDAAAAFLDQRRQGDGAMVVEDRLRRLDHQLQAQRPGREAVDGLDLRERVDQQSDLSAAGDLRERDDEVGRQAAVGFLQQPFEEQVRRPQRALAQLLAEVLDANADEGRQRAVLRAVRDFDRGGGGMAVLFRVRAVAVAVLEIQAEVFDRLAAELLDDPGVHALGGSGIEAEHRDERRAVGRVLAQDAQRRGAEFRRRVRPE